MNLSSILQIFALPISVAITTFALAEQVSGQAHSWGTASIFYYMFLLLTFALALGSVLILLSFWDCMWQEPRKRIGELRRNIRRILRAIPSSRAEAVRLQGLSSRLEALESSFSILRTAPHDLSAIEQEFWEFQVDLAARASRIARQYIDLEYWARLGATRRVVAALSDYCRKNPKLPPGTFVVRADHLERLYDNLEEFRSLLRDWKLDQAENMQNQNKRNARALWRELRSWTGPVKMMQSDPDNSHKDICIFMNNHSGSSKDGGYGSNDRRLLDDLNAAMPEQIVGDLEIVVTLDDKTVRDAWITEGVNYTIEVPPKNENAEFWKFWEFCEIQAQSPISSLVLSPASLSVLAPILPPVQALKDDPPEIPNGHGVLRIEAEISRVGIDGTLTLFRYLAVLPEPLKNYRQRAFWVSTLKLGAVTGLVAALSGAGVWYATGGIGVFGLLAGLIWGPLVGLIMTACLWLPLGQIPDEG